MSKLELFSVNEIACILNLGTKTIYNRIKKLKLIAYKKQNKDVAYYDKNQLLQIKNFYKPEKETPDIIITIHKHTEWHIYPSKLNFIDL